MGFFSDLKEDLSQAVNELTPQEEPANTDTKEENVAAPQAIDLDALLDSIGEETQTVAPVEVAPAPVEEKKAVAKVSDEASVISAGMCINGDITSAGSVELAGSIIGNVDVAGKFRVSGSIEGNSSGAEVFAEGATITGDVVSHGSIKIDRNSVIIGNVFATSAVIAGAVKGDIDVKGPVILDATAIVMGNIKSKSVQINNGAVIEGICSQCYAEVSPSTFFNELTKRK